ncbi:MAG TPA: D-alanyl-D-alanine carboxypeptidase/D-alanyl-D-alanine-endopeptidase [Pyrinomonadaceae bacterium]|nr:D-alanyl-D-alanine carboxypeptidase/D-alanyl-D-alanine-endopeptidase [Pyrinomonadaceae bacterium]
MSPRKNRPKPSAALLLIFALVLAPAVGFTTRGNTAHAQQQRERRVATPTPTPAPTRTPATAPTPTPTPAATDQLRPAQESAAPQTTPEPLPRTPGVAPRTVEELRARIQQVLRQPQLAASHTAVKIVSLDTGRVVFEENAGKWMQPASNMKLYTIAAALDRLTPEFRFNTSVYAPARPDAAGTVRGDLTVYGRGDPTFATRFTGGNDYWTAINDLASRVVAAGVRRVEGDLIGDESYFPGAPLGPGWEWDDLQWYYGAEVSALTVNDNAVDVSVKPGARAGAPCLITVGPQTPLVTVYDRTTTAPRGQPRTLRVHRPLGENVIEISGALPLGDAGFNESLAFSRPAMMFVTMLRTALERQGVVVNGQTRTVDARARELTPLDASSLVEIASRQSPPLSIVAAQTMKPSQNLYTELILRALGRAFSADARRPSDEAGIEAVRAFLVGAGVNPDRVQMTDGSGLSRTDIVTAETTVQLLEYMSRHRYASVFRESLPVAALDGTLRNRMKGTPAAGNVRAKTGTLSSATSLAGYVTTAAGERLAFALMINHPPRDTNPRAGFTDAIAVLLASFAGRS